MQSGVAVEQQDIFKMKQDHKYASHQMLKSKQSKFDEKLRSVVSGAPAITNALRLYCKRSERNVFLCKMK